MFTRSNGSRGTDIEMIPLPYAYGAPVHKIRMQHMIAAVIAGYVKAFGTL